MKKNLTLLFYDFEEFHFGKDVFLVPYYLGILYDYSVTIVYPQKNPDQVFPAFYKNVRLLPVKCYGDKNNINIKDLNLAIYLLKHAKEIDCLMRFHNTPMTALIVILYKLLNPKGYAYVKMDINPYEIENSTTKHDKLYRCLYSKYIQRLDLVSCETTEAFQKLQKSQSFFFNFKDTKWEGFDTKATQVGLNIGAGVKLIQHLQIGVNYQIPLGDSFSWKGVGEALGDEIGGNGKTKTWQISLAYLF